MPPKRKGGKKAKKRNPPLLLDDADTTIMTRDQLEAYALRIDAERQREREERQQFELERDKIRTYWDISRAQYEDDRNELKQKKKELDITKDIANIDSKRLMQQMIYLQLENHTKMGESRAELLTEVKSNQRHQERMQLELQRDKSELTREILEIEEMREMQKREMERRYNEKIQLERIEFEMERKDTLMLQEEIFLDEKEHAEHKYRQQLADIEERKNEQIRALNEHNDLAFNDMKNYYNDITLNNLALISSLKDQLDVLRKQSDRSERLANEAQADLRRMRDPLDDAVKQIEELQRKLEFYERDKKILQKMKSRNTVLENQDKSLTWETEALILRNDALIKERDEMKQKFDEIVIELQQKTGLKNVLLQRKILALQQESEKSQILLQQTQDTCAAAGQIGSGDHQEDISARIEKSVEPKTQIIAALRAEIETTHRAYDNLLETCEFKLKSLGITEEDLGFIPMRYNKRTEEKYLCGPNGLISEETQQMPESHASMLTETQTTRSLPSEKHTSSMETVAETQNKSYRASLASSIQSVKRTSKTSAKNQSVESLLEINESKRNSRYSTVDDQEKRGSHSTVLFKLDDLAEEQTDQFTS